MRLRGIIDKYWHIKLLIIAALVALLPILAIGDDEPVEEPSPEEQPAQVEEVQADYIGTTNCLMCHADYKDGFLLTRHALSLGNPKARPAEQGCEQCHGPGSLHTEAIGNESGERGIFVFAGDRADEQYLSTCLKCHVTRIDSDDWTDSEHKASGLQCASCHDVHNGKYNHQLLKESSLDLCYSCHTSMKTQFEASRSHHPLKDDTGCTICHNPHGEPVDFLATEMLNDTCGKCHADTAGPFIYQHLGGTSDMGEGCLSCHMPHSSGNLNLLKLNGRALCLSCHTEMAEHKGAVTCWTSGCHSQVHGSNDNLLFIR